MRTIFAPSDQLRVQVQVHSALDARGGGAAHARGLTAALRAAGCDTHVVCTGWGGAPDDARFGVIDVCRPRALPLLWRWPPLGTLSGWVGMLRRLPAADLVVSLSAELAVATRWARPHTPVIYCPASLLALEHAGSRAVWRRRCERRALHDAAGVLYPSAATGAAAAAIHGPGTGRVGVCALGVTPRQLVARDAARAALELPADAFVLLTVGVINDNKGQTLIADALAEGTPARWWWLVVGDGPQRQQLADRLRGTPLETHARFLPPDADLAGVFPATDVFVGASRCETFGLAAAEALAAGLPVVLPANEPDAVLSPLADLVIEEHLGRTYRRADATELREALQAVAAADAGEDTRAEYRERVVPPAAVPANASRAADAERIRRTAAELFSWDRYAAAVLDLARAACPVPAR